MSTGADEFCASPDNKKKKKRKKNAKEEIVCHVRLERPDSEDCGQAPHGMAARGQLCGQLCKETTAADETQPIPSEDAAKCGASSRPPIRWSTDSVLGHPVWQESSADYRC